MPSKSRQIACTYINDTRLSGGQLNYFRSFKVSESIVSTRTSLGNACQHVKALNTLNGRVRDNNLMYPPGNVNRQPQYADNYLHLPATIGGSGLNIPTEVWNQVYDGFASMQADMSESSGFELLPFLFDLDSTIAMFTKKFVKQLSYGSVTWGVLPFISDLKALFVSLRSLFRSRSSSCSRVTRKRPIVWSADLEAQSNGQRVRVTHAYGVCRLAGVVTYTAPKLESVFDKAFFLLDRLGVHPDIQTAWEIIPLSFVVDYFLPISGLLESLHPRGWLDSAISFQGWNSIRMNLIVEDVWKWPGMTTTPYDPITYRVYMRNPGLPPARPSPDWQTPNLRELFNTLFLATKASSVDATGILKRVDTAKKNSKIVFYKYRRS